jgi:regulator of nucleoside diphosphate kinase
LQNRVVRPLLVTEADYANLSLLPSPALRGWLAGATRVWSDAMPPDIVTMNTQVACIDQASGERRVLAVVYPDDADASAGRLSATTDAGMGLLGARAGETIEWREPDGQLRRFYIERLVYQPEQDLRAKLVFAPFGA